MFKAIRNTAFIVFLLFSLASLAFSASVWALIQTQKIAAFSTVLASKVSQNNKVVAKLIKRHTQEITKLKLEHKKELARQRAAGRLKRIAVAVPFAGSIAAVYFEEKDRRMWLVENPEKNSSDYACELASLTTEVSADVLDGLPESLHLPDWAFIECNE